MCSVRAGLWLECGEVCVTAATPLLFTWALFRRSRCPLNTCSQLTNSRGTINSCRACPGHAWLPVYVCVWGSVCVLVIECALLCPGDLTGWGNQGNTEQHSRTYAAGQTPIWGHSMPAYRPPVVISALRIDPGMLRLKPEVIHASQCYKRTSREWIR